MDAIIIVDLQKAFPVPSDVIRRIEQRMKPFPFRVFTRFINPPDSVFRRRLGRQSCAPGAPDTELLLTPAKEDLVLEKPSYGLGADHVAALHGAGVRRALVCGVDTDACVLGVCFSLFDAGIECEVDPDLCWSSMGLHDVALKILRAQFGTG